MKEEYLTPEEVAEKLKVTKTTVYRMARKGTIPAFKFGNVWRVSLVKLEKMIENEMKK